MSEARFHLKSNFQFFSDTANVFIPTPFEMKNFFLLLQYEVCQDYQHQEFFSFYSTRYVKTINARTVDSKTSYLMIKSDLKK